MRSSWRSGKECARRRIRSCSRHISKNTPRDSLRLSQRPPASVARRFREEREERQGQGKAGEGRGVKKKSNGVQRVSVTQTRDSTTPPEGWPASLQSLAEAGLPDFLLRQRWYPAKDAGPPEVRLAGWVPFPNTGQCAAVAVWRVTPPNQAPVRLFVPVAVLALEEADAAQVIATLPQEQPGAKLAIVEAFSLDCFVRAWVGALLREPLEEDEFEPSVPREIFWLPASIPPQFTNRLPRDRNYAGRHTARELTPPVRESARW
jgi:hypothetical protein